MGTEGEVINAGLLATQVKDTNLQIQCKLHPLPCRRAHLGVRDTTIVSRLGVRLVLAVPSKKHVSTTFRDESPDR